MAEQPCAAPARQLSPERQLSKSQPVTALHISPAPEPPALVIFSGGTALNSVAGHLRSLTTRVAHVLPVSDDGGSTAEISRVLGGPAVGDIRSRCLRLADDSDEEARAVKSLLGHRLSATDSEAAKAEWHSLVEGDHPLWVGVSHPYKSMICRYLVEFQTQILTRGGSSRFNFCNGSIGNFFFAGAHVFFHSIEAAIFMFHRLARLPEHTRVLPAIITEERITLGAHLVDGTVVRGQNQISHPSRTGLNLQVDKSGERDVPLPSPIRRVLYLASDGAGPEREAAPVANPEVLSALRGADAVVYGMGSLYTSICPSLCLVGVGEAIAGSTAPKILLLNGTHDRETSCAVSHPGPMNAVDVVHAVCDALNRQASYTAMSAPLPPSAYVTCLLMPRGGAIQADRAALRALGVRHIAEVDTTLGDAGQLFYEPQALVRALGDALLQLQHGGGSATP